MYFNVVPIDVYRKTVISGFSDPVWSYNNTIKGTICELKGSDFIKNNQRFPVLINMIICDSNYFDKVLYSDELIASGQKYYRVLQVKEPKNVIPHVEILVGETQWVRE